MLNRFENSRGRIRDNNDLAKIMEALTNPVACAILALLEESPFTSPTPATVQQWLMNHRTHWQEEVELPDTVYKYHLEEARRVVHPAFPLPRLNSLPYPLYIAKAFFNLFESELMDMGDYDNLLGSWRDSARSLLPAKVELLVVEEVLVASWERFAQTPSWQAHQARADELTTAPIDLPPDLNPWEYLDGLDSWVAILAVRWYGQYKERVTANGLAKAVHNLTEKEAQETLDALVQGGVMWLRDGQYTLSGQHIPVLAYICKGMFGFNDLKVRELLKEAVAFKNPSVNQQ